MVYSLNCKRSGKLNTLYKAFFIDTKLPPWVLFSLIRFFLLKLGAGSPWSHTNPFLDNFKPLILWEPGLRSLDSRSICDFQSATSICLKRDSRVALLPCCGRYGKENIAEMLPENVPSWPGAWSDPRRIVCFLLMSLAHVVLDVTVSKSINVTKVLRHFL